MIKFFDVLCQVFWTPQVNDSKLEIQRNRIKVLHLKPDTNASYDISLFSVCIAPSIYYWEFSLILEPRSILQVPVASQGSISWIHGKWRRSTIIE